MLRNFSIVAQTTISRNSAKNPSNAFLADIITILLISIRTRLPSTPPRINHPHLLPRSSVAPDSTLSPLQPVTETRGNRKKKSGRPVTSVHSNPYARIPRSRSRPIVPTARPLVQAAARPTKPFCLREQSSPRFVSTRPPLDSLEIDGPGIITFSRTVCC